MFHHTGTHGNQSMHVLRCNITCPLPCSHISCGYPNKMHMWLIYVYNACANAYAYSFIKTFSLPSYRYVNKLACVQSSKHDNHDDDKMSTLHVICQFFTCQNFPSPDSSKFFTIKILHHTVTKLSRKSDNLVNSSVATFSYLH